MGFQKNFLWGAASASYQVEGAYQEDGKGLNIWDALCEGKVKHGDNGNTACDHYHRYCEDVAMMKQLGLKAYRFSISWARIFPDDTGKVNEAGLQFYSNLVDELKKAGIEPLITLYHWDLPMWIHEKGGWKNSEIVAFFEKYTEVVVNALSDRVKYWITFNEPQCFVGLGYICGQHAPFEVSQDRMNIMTITKNVMAAHAAAVKKIRKIAKVSPQIGFATTSNTMIPLSESKEEIEKAREATFSPALAVFGTACWMDPIILGKAPQGAERAFTAEELANYAQPLDFYAVNIYNSDNYSERPGQKNEQVYSGMPRTTMDWPITPDVMYWTAKFVHERYGLPVLVTENGMSNCDFVMLDGKVHDPQRIDFLHRYLLSVKKAVDEGIPFVGYLYWSILDNFEWAEGYDKRFGLVHVDYDTQVRTLKDSAYFYADVIKSNGKNL